MRRSLAMCSLALLLISSCGTGAKSKGVADGKQIQFPVGKAVTVDGTLAAGEWSDAGRLDLAVAEGWTVQVHVKHDAQNLYIAFTNLIGPGGQERYPEVLLDVAHEKGESLSANVWWLHASYNDCEGKGAVNVWDSCAKSRPGWEANNFPMKAPGVIEMRIPYETVGLKAGQKNPIGIGFDVTDTRSAYHFWPATAKLDQPSTWGEAVAPKGW